MTTEIIEKYYSNYLKLEKNEISYEVWNDLLVELKLLRIDKEGESE